ncbi:MAG: hypothetical protein EKK62_16505 [Acidimicrobiia bacterium]|nr:MAG: hypothetical protein EKK62_16505 [Acidimicrobiia bacterium]
MAAVIDSEHKVEDMHDTGVHGFTSGDAPANSPPTELTADWCNAVQQEINNGIAAAEINLNTAKDDQLGGAIQEIAYVQKPRSSGKTATLFQFDTDTAQADAATWGEYKRTGRDFERTGGGATFELAEMAMLPNNCAVLIDFDVTLVRSDDKTVYLAYSAKGDFYRGTNNATSAAVSQSGMFASGSAAATATLVKSSNGYPAIQIDPSGLSAAKTWNTTVVVRVVATTQS